MSSETIAAIERMRRGLAEVADRIAASQKGDALAASHALDSIRWAGQDLRHLAYVLDQELERLHRRAEGVRTVTCRVDPDGTEHEYVAPRECYTWAVRYLLKMWDQGFRYVRGLPSGDFELRRRKRKDAYPFDSHAAETVIAKVIHQGWGYLEGPKSTAEARERFVAAMVLEGFDPSPYRSPNAQLQGALTFVRDMAQARGGYGYDPKIGFAYAFKAGTFSQSSRGVRWLERLTDWSLRIDLNNLEERLEKETIVSVLAEITLFNNGRIDISVTDQDRVPKFLASTLGSVFEFPTGAARVYPDTSPDRLEWIGKKIADRLSSDNKLHRRLFAGPRAGVKGLREYRRLSSPKRSYVKLDPACHGAFIKALDDLQQKKPNLGQYERRSAAARIAGIPDEYGGVDRRRKLRELETRLRTPN